MRDRIEISALRVVTVVGALPHEREIAQPLQVDLSLDVDLIDAGHTDELGDTVDYGRVAEHVRTLVTESKDVLLERLASRIADDILLFDRVDGVEVALTKLRPPIPADVETTSVRLRRIRTAAQPAPGEPTRAVLALGSNLGDREGYLRFAVDQLGPLAAESQVFETDPIGGPEGQGPFLNMVVAIETHLDPFALLRRCQRIEAEAMRQRVQHWGPRTLDVDIVEYNGVTIESDELTIPHPRYAERRFVLAPLAEIAPELCPDGWDDRLPPDGVHPRGRLER